MEPIETLYQELRNLCAQALRSPDQSAELPIKATKLCSQIVAQVHEQTVRLQDLALKATLEAHRACLVAEGK